MIEKKDIFFNFLLSDEGLLSIRVVKTLQIHVLSWVGGQVIRDRGAYYPLQNNLKELISDISLFQCAQANVGWLPMSIPSQPFEL